MLMDYVERLPKIQPGSQSGLEANEGLRGSHFQAETIGAPKANRNQPDIGTLILNAKVLMKNQEYSLASHLIRQSLYLNSYHKESLKMLAECFDQLEQKAQALRVLFLLDRIEESFESASRLAHFQYDNEQYVEAKDSYFRSLNKLNDSHPHQFEIYKNLGNIFLREGDGESAEEFYHKAYSLNGQSPVLLVNLGTLAFQRNDIELALARFRGALELDVQNDKAWVGLAITHAQMGDAVLAQANVDSALDVNPMNRTAVQLAADWGLHRRDFDYVIEILTHYVSNVRYDEDISLLLTHSFCLAGRLGEAKLELERMLLWNPTNEKLQQIEREMKGIL